jgi:hypothetical protein
VSWNCECRTNGRAISVLSATENAYSSGASCALALLLNNRMTENEFARRNDRLISKWVFRFGLAVYTVLFVAATAAFGAVPQTETGIACQAKSSGSLIFGNREQADRDGANHLLHQSAMRSGRPRGKLFRGLGGFLQIRRKTPPLNLVISLQTQTIAYKAPTPDELLLEAVRIWCKIHSTLLE